MFFLTPDSCSATVDEWAWSTTETFTTMIGQAGYSMETSLPFNSGIGGYYSPARGIACGNWFPLSVTNPDQSKIYVAPNPASTTIQLTFHQPISGTLDVLDATGRQIQTKQLTANDLVTLDVSALSPSIYFIRVLTNDGVYTGKFVKQ
jgi:hypothetical protein